MKFQFVLLLLFFIPSAYAQISVDTGIIMLDKINQPPMVEEIDFSGELNGGEVGCNVLALDERPETLTLEYAWYVNDEYVSDAQTFADYNSGDFVRCMVTPIDDMGEIGLAKGISMQAEFGLNAITGLATGSGSGLNWFFSWFR